MPARADGDSEAARRLTDSRRVAKHFGKRHDDVLRKARKVIHDAGDFALRNFV